MLTKFSAFFKLYSLPILSGVLIGTSFIPFPPWASYFGFVPLWIFWTQNKKLSLKSVILAGWLTGFVLTLIGFNWVAYTAHEFGHFPWWASILVLLSFASFANLDLAITGALWWWLSRRLKLKEGPSFAMLALLTAICETYFPTIFAWNYGYTFYWSHWPQYQVAELIGFQGLSTLVILSNMIFLRAALTKGRQRLIYLGAAAAVILCLNVAGLALKASLQKPNAHLRVAIVQANIGNLEKQMAERGSGYRDHIVNRYVQLSQRELIQTPQKPDFLVWPETAVPSFMAGMGQPDIYTQMVRTFVRGAGVPLVTGGYGYDMKSDRSSNSLFILDRDGTIQKDYYSKSKLLAFGEYTPLADVFPIIQRWTPAGEFFRGPGPSVKELESLKIGMQICYESLFPEFSVSLARQGAQVIVNVTNDSWFGWWEEPYQHMMMTLARAVELRRPLIRSTNSGISTVALANGDILQQSPQRAEWAHTYDVPYNTHPEATLYELYPWLTDALLLILLCVILLRGTFDRKREQ